MSIAKDTNIPWKVIAKINRLKAPYSIKPGQTIIIPSYKNTNEKK
jgi:nucleoid-associated protein YgaU